MLCVHVCVWRVYICYTVAYNINIHTILVLSNVYILQGLKKGIVEIADVIAIIKADGDLLECTGRVL